MNSLFNSLDFRCGKQLKNRFALAPLTNLQSHDNGALSEDEYRWLTLRAKGGFGLTMTCAASVHVSGLGFRGQLACYDDVHDNGLQKLADGIRSLDSLALIQLHHAGMRSPEDLIGSQPVCPSENEQFNARALRLEEVHELRDSFVEAAERAQRAGFDGVELHAAHGYLIGQFLSPEINLRSDSYGGTPENRARFLLEMIELIRQRCGREFVVGVRLSPERFGIDLLEMRALTQQLCSGGQVDFIDLSLWDVFKAPAEGQFGGRSLLSWFTDLDWGDTRLGVAGKIAGSADAQRAMSEGADFVLPGRSAILHYNFPEKCAEDAAFKPIDLPVSRTYLAEQGVGEAFMDYLSTWKGFVHE